MSNTFEQSSVKEEIRLGIIRQILAREELYAKEGDTFKYASLPGENGNFELDLYHEIKEKTNKYVELNCYEHNKSIFQKADSFAQLDQMETPPNDDMFPDDQHFKADGLHVQYRNDEFNVDPAVDGFWADFCGFPTTATLYSICNKIERMENKNQVFHITFSYIPKYRQSLSPAIIASMNKHKALGDANSFVAAVDEVFDGFMHKITPWRHTKIFSYVYRSNNHTMITFGYHKVFNSQIHRIFENKLTQPKEKQTKMTTLKNANTCTKSSKTCKTQIQSKTQTKTTAKAKSNSQAKVVNLEDAIRFMISKGHSSKHIAEAFGISTGTVAAHKAWITMRNRNSNS